MLACSRSSPGPALVNQPACWWRSHLIQPNRNFLLLTSFSSHGPQCLPKLNNPSWEYRKNMLFTKTRQNVVLIYKKKIQSSRDRSAFSCSIRDFRRPLLAAIGKPPLQVLQQEPRCPLGRLATLKAEGSNGSSCIPAPALLIRSHWGFQRCCARGLLLRLLLLAFRTTRGREATISEPPASRLAGTEAKCSPRR